MQPGAVPDGWYLAGHDMGTLPGVKSTDKETRPARWYAGDGRASLSTDEILALTRGDA